MERDVETVKMMIMAVIKTSKVMEEVLEDGKIDWMEFFSFYEPAMALKKSFESMEALIAELKDLQEDELNEIHEFIKEEFDLANDLVEYYVERAITISVLLLEMFMKMKKK